MTDAPRVGDVWNFPFLWKSEERCDETEGRKHRPCASCCWGCIPFFLVEKD